MSFDDVFTRNQPDKVEPSNGSDVIPRRARPGLAGPGPDKRPTPTTGDAEVGRAHARGGLEARMVEVNLLTFSASHCRLK